ncbi:MAG TPA: HAD-IIIC family phosphatase [Pseudomonadales bacterium]|nr:HAD-IIIC family phosphatase [Pseudomonadales bacterium]
MAGIAYPFDSASLLRKKKALRRELSAQSGLVEKRIAILGGSTTDEVADMLELFLLMRGIQPRFYQSAYNQYFSECMQPEPALRDFKPELVYLHTSSVNIQAYPAITASEADVRTLFEQQMAHFSAAWQGIRTHFNCPVIQNNFEQPWERALGNLDGSDFRGKSRFVARLNDAFADASQKIPGLTILDIHYLSARIGLDRWFNPRQWHLYKYAMDSEAIVELAWQLSAVMAGICGLSKKCLVLDLDNTLWGGVIGDDGVDGIAIGTGSAEAEAYSELQRYLRELKHRGILLAVCSKNDEANARAGFLHPDSILQQDDFSAFFANWDNKPDNLLKIADTLGIGIDSLVFLDDNPAERELVRQQLPTVTVPDIGSDITDYIRRLDRAALFETTNLSAEDLLRSQQYQQNAERHLQQNHFADYQDFLRSLDMRAIIERFQPSQLERICQLTNKTNQFNLTTRRMTLPELQHIAASKAYITLAGQLRDRFGDNGLVSVVIGKIIGSNLDIELWLMSCRVLKRGLEAAMLDVLCRQASAQDITTLTGFYIRSDRNSMVVNLYRELGFSLIAETSQGSTWQLALTPATHTLQHCIHIGNG